MSPHLVDLQPELLLNIISNLLPNNFVIQKDDLQDKDKNQSDRNSGQTSQNGKDNEEVEKEKSSHSTLLNWSCTCCSFRRLLAPYIFHTVTLRNNEESAASINAIAQHPEYSKCVRQLRFRGTAPGDARRSDPEFSDTADILPSSAATLLSNLKQFLSFESLSVEFPFDFENMSEWEEEGVNTAGEMEPDEEVGPAEETEAWRALMAKVWEAISRNEGGMVKTLTIKNLYYKKVSTFLSPPFHTFLSHLHTFHLSIFGGDNGACWQSNTCTTWSGFVPFLSPYFFSHLTSVTSLSLRATQSAPLGLDGMNHGPLNLRKDDMPALRKVYFEWLFVSPQLRDFLVGHVETLEEVHLHNCIAETDTSMAEDGIPWSALFSALTDVQPKNLRCFALSADKKASLPGDSGEEDDFDVEEGQDEAVLERQLKQGKETVKRGERRVFPHVTVDDKYGFLFEDVEGNFVSLREGRDEEAWGKLRGLVGRNRGDGEGAGGYLG